ncbi:uncharacterized protein LOC142983904 isoform X2 [Anticarsia gemmatalis]|uniref:uncharacterized protein LOC142983904 isoform X2 n=1 Tax=Anticarsia gemmatalis TaxID=129554 RepID=UPI003F761F54
MNSDFQEGKRGASITPSARKSIHSYREEDMGRYGLNKSNERNIRGNTPANNDPGEDQVDNVMSKMARQTSPLPTRRKKIIRTNSYSQEEETTENSDDSDLEEPNYSAASLSKSRLEDSLHSQVNRSNQFNNSDHFQTPPYRRKSSISGLPARNKQQSGSNMSTYLLLTIVIAILAALYIKYPQVTQYLQNNNKDKSTQTVNYDEVLFENNMNNLQEKYNIDQNSILKLKSGISTIFSRMDAGSFMFVYNTDTNNFNLTQFEKFINEVAYTAARYLRNNLSSMKHTVVTSSSLDMQEHGELISRYRDDVDKTGVLLVKEVDSIPSELAMAFHYYCDEYEPLVKRSAIFFTLNLANCSSTTDKKTTHDFIEKCLAKKWKTAVPPENMRPLLTRVVDIIIDVTTAF